jgi:hypothetical protein
MLCGTGTEANEVRVMRSGFDKHERRIYIIKETSQAEAEGLRPAPSELHSTGKNVGRS